VEAVTGFLRTLPEGTRYALWITGDRPKKILDFTSDVAAAREPLRRVFPQGGNTVFDALVEVSRELKKLEGQRTAIVVVTGLGIGFTNWDRRQVVDEGAKSGAVFLVASFEDARTTVEGGRSGDGEIGIADYEYALTTLARNSGGRREALLSVMGLAPALLRLSAELKGQYRLGYLALPSAKERKLEVTVARPGAKARVAPAAR